MTQTFIKRDSELDINRHGAGRYPYRTPSWNSALQIWEVGKWLVRGRPSVLPDLLKRRVIANYAIKFHLDTFVESGTYLGGTVEYVSRFCSRIYSVEFQEHLWRAACQRFASRPGIRILYGSGASIMPNIVAEIKGPALFWLDGHFAAGTTSREEVACPTLGELIAILKHPYDHVILLDDVREFRGELGYPSYDEVIETIRALRPDAQIQVLRDIMRITPTRNSSSNSSDAGAIG